MTLKLNRGTLFTCTCFLLDDCIFFVFKITSKGPFFEMIPNNYPVIIGFKINVTRGVSANRIFNQISSGLFCSILVCEMLVNPPCSI